MGYAAEDNHDMNKERDLLPWIFGGLSAAAIAVAFAAASTHRADPAIAPQIVAAQAVASTSALQPPSSAPLSAAASSAAEPNSDSPPAPLQTQAAVAPEVSSGQIWECTTKGVKTFSNNPCGEKSTLLDVGPINTMSPTPAIHYARGYGSEPRYATGYADQGAPGDTDDSDQYAAETGGNSYTIIQGVGLVARRRPEHFHRPSPSPAPAPHHNPAPVRRY